jgi:hypothetical protein
MKCSLSALCGQAGHFTCGLVELSSPKPSASSEADIAAANFAKPAGSFEDRIIEGAVVEVW